VNPAYAELWHGAVAEAITAVVITALAVVLFFWALGRVSK